MKTDRPGRAVYDYYDGFMENFRFDILNSIMGFINNRFSHSEWSITF